MRSAALNPPGIVMEDENQQRDIRVFPKVDHSASVARIVLVEYNIGLVVELNFC